MKLDSSLYTEVLSTVKLDEGIICWQFSISSLVRDEIFGQV